MIPLLIILLISILFSYWELSGYAEYEELLDKYKQKFK